jgi:hypothetical protein
MKTTLAEKKNRININDAKRTFNVNLTTERTVMFLAVEKNGQLPPAAPAALEWCKKNGFEMTSRPVKNLK